MNSQEKDFHLAAHKQAAAHSASLAKCHQDAADCHGAMSKACEITEPAMSKKLAEVAACHKSAANAYVQNGAFHVSACEKISQMQTNEGPEANGIDRGSSELKTISDKLDKLLNGGLPVGVRAIPTGDARPTLVPRPGQPTAADRIDKSQIDPALVDLVIDSKQAVG
jgi:hypothetical protein